MTGGALHRTAVVNVVGLTPQLIGDGTPFLSKWAAEGKSARIDPVFPAVTCPAQTSYLTGTTPRWHGIVGNGWYFREECEIKFWRQSNHLVQAPRIWQRLSELDPTATTANLFWWYNMYAGVDIAATPRPMYPADGRKLPDLHTKPAGLRHELQRELGTFPLFHFWGPATSIRASRWIADAARIVEERHGPTLTLVYLPHLDYCLQRRGSNPAANAGDLLEIDSLCADLIRFYEERGVRVIVLSEYGITGVSRPVSLNRVLRRSGLLAVRDELGRDMLDAGASAAFAVADHQVAHVYVNDPDRLAEVRDLIEKTEGVELVLDRAGKATHGLDHPRAGDLVAVAARDAWFTYYHWLDDARAPDFARTVDIHRKPGYDPVELFLDPALRFPRLKIASRLARKALGFRTLMDVVPIDPSLVRGSHGRLPDDDGDAPVIITRHRAMMPGSRLPATDVHDVIMAHLVGDADQVTAKRRPSQTEAGSRARITAP